MANIMLFGKHKGKDIEDVPSNYLEWFVQQDFSYEEYAQLVESAEAELAYRTDHSAHFVD